MFRNTIRLGLIGQFLLVGIAALLCVIAYLLGVLSGVEWPPSADAAWQILGSLFGSLIAIIGAVAVFALQDLHVIRRDVTFVGELIDHLQVVIDDAENKVAFSDPEQASIAIELISDTLRTVQRELLRLDHRSVIVAEIVTVVDDAEVVMRDMVNMSPNDVTKVRPEIASIARIVRKMKQMMRLVHSNPRREATGLAQRQ